MDVLQVKNPPAFSAIYYALLQNGYEYIQHERTPEHLQKILLFRLPDSPFLYFSQIRQTTCEVYPFWPRAALLELASLCIDDTTWRFRDFDLLRHRIMRVPNLREEERNVDFWDWLIDFPPQLHCVMASKGFADYLVWETNWLRCQTAQWKEELNAIQKAVQHCSRQFGFSCPKVELAISPIKCVYSADYHFINDRFIYSSGRLNISSVVHEFLHPVVHPLVLTRRAEILKQKPVYPELDSSYYLNGTAEGYLNAFEEKLVRSLTGELLCGHPPEKLDAFMLCLLKEC